jgi:hypothetical protein
MRSTPLIMTTAILVEHHSETNAGPSITAVTKLVQPRALCRWAVLRLNGHAAKSDPPPKKWSDLRYVFGIKEDRNGKEAIQA